MLNLFIIFSLFGLSEHKCWSGSPHTEVAAKGNICMHNNIKTTGMWYQVTAISECTVPIMPYSISCYSCNEEQIHNQVYKLAF